MRDLRREEELAEAAVEECDTGLEEFISKQFPSHRAE